MYGRPRPMLFQTDWEKPCTMERLQVVGEGKNSTLSPSAHRAPREMPHILPWSSLTLHNTKQEESSLLHKQENEILRDLPAVAQLVGCDWNSGLSDATSTFFQHPMRPAVARQLAECELYTYFWHPLMKRRDPKSGILVQPILKLVAGVHSIVIQRSSRSVPGTKLRTKLKNKWPTIL